MFKYELNQLVFYMQDNKVHSANILSRKYIDNNVKNYNDTNQKIAFRKLGESTIEYATIDGIFTEDEVFTSREDLINSL